MYIAIKTNEKTRKMNTCFNKEDIVVMENLFYRVYQFSRVSCFSLHMQFRPDQECVSCEQIDWIFCSLYLFSILEQKVAKETWGGGGGGLYYSQWKHSGYWKDFSKVIHSTSRTNRTINPLIRPRRASYCAIIGGFQLLVQNKLFPSFNCHIFCNALQNALLTLKYYECVLKISEKIQKQLLLLLVKFH